MVAGSLPWVGFIAVRIIFAKKPVSGCGENSTAFFFFFLAPVECQKKTSSEQ